MRQGLFPFLVLQTGGCGLHPICGGAGLNDHSCHFKLLINCSAKKWTYFLGVVCSLGVVICIGTKKRGYVCTCVCTCMCVCACAGVEKLKQIIRKCELCIFTNVAHVLGHIFKSSSQLNSCNIVGVQGFTAKFYLFPKLKFKK